MSDALTDIARDERRAEKFSDFVETVIKYLGQNSDKNKKAVKDAAESCDNVPMGYWSGPTSLAKNLDDWLYKLVNQDEKVWLKWLLRTRDNYNTNFDRLKKISPYRGKTIVLVDYGFGFGNLGGEIQNQFDKIIADNGYATYDADKYAIILDAPIKGKIEWLGNGSNEYRTPVKAERNEIKKKKNHLG